MLRIPENLANPITGADWIELSCLFSEFGKLSRSETNSLLEQEAVKEELVEAIWDHLSWRESYLNTKYPLSLSQFELERKEDWSHSLSYAFMLLISCASFYSETEILDEDVNLISDLFENLVSVLMGNCLGRSIKVGFPRNDPTVPSGFQDCVNFICDEIDEQPATPDPNLFRNQKDAGLDIVAWSPFDDRTGKITLFIQCGCGKNWYQKLGDLSIEYWRGFIKYNINPLRAMAFPFVGDNINWRRYTLKGGLLLDRLRLTQLNSINLPSPLQLRLHCWIKNQLEKVKLVEI